MQYTKKVMTMIHFVQFNIKKNGRCCFLLMYLCMHSVENSWDKWNSRTILFDTKNLLDILFRFDSIFDRKKWT